MSEIRVSDAETEGAFLRSDYFIKSISGKYVLSSVMAMVFLYASSLIDTVLVGLFIGESGLSAMSLVSPVYLIYYTVGALVGIGASISASRELGRGNEKSYNVIFSTALEIMIGLAVVMTVCGYAFVNPITDLLARGVDEAQHTMVKQYLLSYFPGGACNLIGYISMYFLKTDGRPKIAANLYSLSAVINIILSALLISPICGLGVAGAGAATSFSLAISTAIGMIRLLDGRAVTKFEWIGLSGGRLKEMLISGLPNGLSNFLESMRILFVNVIIVSIGCAAMLPCYTVIRNVSDIISAVIIGISSALVPMMGVFFGERDYNGERILLRHAKKRGLCAVVPIIAGVCVLSRLVFLVFGVSDPAIIREGMIAMPLATVGLIFGYINTLNIGYLTVVKREGLATLLVALRLFLLLAAFALPLALALGTYGVWASLSLSEIGTALIFRLIRHFMVARDPNLDRYLLDISKEREGDLSFSVRNSEQNVVNASEQIVQYCEEHDVDRKRAMRLSLSIEEILVFLINRCVGTDSEKYIDIRVCKLEEEVMIRFRYTGRLFDLVSFYQENADNQEMQDELLGIKMIMKSAVMVDFKQILGANNLMLIF